MNPYSLILIGLGLICFIIGLKGSQHEVVAAFQGLRGGPKKTTPSLTGTPKPGSSTPGSVPGSSGTTQIM